MTLQAFRFEGVDGLPGSDPLRQRCEAQCRGAGAGEAEQRRGEVSADSGRSATVVGCSPDTGRPVAVILAANSATVGAAARSVGATTMACASRSATIIWTTDMESPPRA